MKLSIFVKNNLAKNTNKNTSDTINHKSNKPHAKKPFKIHGIAIKSLCAHPNYENLYSPTFYSLKKDGIFYARVLSIDSKPLIVEKNNLTLESRIESGETNYGAKKGDLAQNNRIYIYDLLGVGWGGGGLFLGVPKVLDSKILGTKTDFLKNLDSKKSPSHHLLPNFSLAPASDSRSYEKSYDALYNTFPTMLGSSRIAVLQRAGEVSYKNELGKMQIYTNATYIFSTTHTANLDFYAGWEPSFKGADDVIAVVKINSQNISKNENLPSQDSKTDSKIDSKIDSKNSQNENANIESSYKITQKNIGKNSDDIEFLGYYPLSNRAKEEYDRYVNGIDYYYVIVSAGQSNSMAFGEGTPDYLDLDKPDSRIKQLARRKSTQTSKMMGGERVEIGTLADFNDIIALDHCPHDVMDMSVQNNPNMDEAANFQDYGCHSQLLNICKKLLPSIPKNAGILVVPCGSGGSGFDTSLALGSFSESYGASSDSRRWGLDTPLYKDMLLRTKAAMKSNENNILLGILWTQGESDIASEDSKHSAAITAFEAMRADFNARMFSEFKGRVAGGFGKIDSKNSHNFKDSKNLTQNLAQDSKTNPAKDSKTFNIPWFCGDTTYWWIQNFKNGYEKIYGNYKNREDEHIYFCAFGKDSNEKWSETNKPDEDADGVYKSGARYSGAGHRIDAKNGQTTSIREAHFSTKSHQGIISDVIVNIIKKAFGL